MLRCDLPVFDQVTHQLVDGERVVATPLCRKLVGTDQRCAEHYRALLEKPAGYHECPFGFTSRSFFLLGQAWVITGIVAHPRFGDVRERQIAKRFPKVKVTRAEIDQLMNLYAQIERLRQEAIERSARLLPQSLHELRKLNAAVIHTVEKEIDRVGEEGALLTIRSSAELMRNNFDILEALSNIQNMKALPMNDSINLFDLTYKTKKVYEQRANSRKVYLQQSGVRAIVMGSRKSLPIVPAVLLENAIKYGHPNSTAYVDVQAVGSLATLTVSKETEFVIDPISCFDKGTRFAGESVEGGGFGLYLAREIVLAHGGQIRCEKSGRLVRMIVDLPLHKVIPMGGQ